MAADEGLQMVVMGQRLLGSPVDELGDIVPRGEGFSPCPPDDQDTNIGILAQLHRASAAGRAASLRSRRCAPQDD